MEISVIIPTRDRPDDLSRCLSSLVNQTSPPEEILIIDDGDLGTAFKVKWTGATRSKGISLEIHQKTPPGTATSRNYGVSVAKKDIVLILDDDAEAEPDAVERIKKEWDNKKGDEKLAGIGGLIRNLHKPGPLENLYRSVFGLTGKKSWDITEAGFQVWDPLVTSPVEGYFLTGGTASFRKDVLKKIPFKQRGKGRSPGEDTEFFWMAKKQGYHFILDPAIRFQHRESPAGREGEFTRGLKEGANQKAIFREHGELRHSFLFTRSMTGWILKQFLRGKILRALGMTMGVVGGRG